jgi:hypothetical protein
MLKPILLKTKTLAKLPRPPFPRRSTHRCHRTAYPGHLPSTHKAPTHSFSRRQRQFRDQKEVEP